MSTEYNEYLKAHKENVSRAFDWMITNLPNVLEPDIALKAAFQIKLYHDASKGDLEEYDAYDKYFYGGERTQQTVDDFNRAWLHHIHKNPHHWQHWVLIEDDADGEPICIEMPQEYVIEMICDWWSFSWKTGNLGEIFSWYDKHDNIKLHPNTRALVESILQQMREKLSTYKEAEND